jgi:signal transduction histidine kinase
VSEQRGRAVAFAALTLIALVAVYASTAELGLRFDALAGVATTVWPPTGIAIAALVLCGRRFWPGIFLAALLVNAGQGIPLWAALLIAAGNTLEAVAAQMILQRMSFRQSMDRVRDVGVLAVTALLVTTISASLGTLAIWLAKIPVKDGMGFFWMVWWVGDVLGALLVAPVVFTWTSDWRVRGGAARWVESTILVTLLVLVAMAVFQDFFKQRVILLVRGTYSVWPLLIWAAIRFRQRGTAVMLLLVSLVAISGTAAGQGVFAAETLHERLFRVQCYMAVTAVSMMTLAAALAERRQAIRARDEFISIASHELKTPLTALRLRLGSAERWLASSTPATSAKVGHALGAASTVTDRLARLIDDLLDVSRLTSHRMVLDLEEFNLATLLAEVATHLREQAQEGGSSIALELDGDGGTLTGRWDRVRLEQVVSNLLSNAIKYGAGKEIVVSARGDGPHVMVAVKDGGIGISKADQARIFHAFERVASVHRVGGLGLGLYIGRRIAEAHGGTLTVSSEPGHGSTFVLDLPREAAPPVKPA